MDNVHTQLLPLQDPLGSVRSYGATRKGKRTVSMEQSVSLRESASVINFHASKRTRPRSQSEGNRSPLALSRRISRASIAESEALLDEEDYDELEESVEGLDTLLLDDSPYAEVRACVTNRDDPDMDPNTLRMWTIALLFTVLGSAVNLFFSLRFPSIAITALLAQLLSHPLGIAWERYLPDIELNLLVVRVKLNDTSRPWNAKEHCCVFIASNVSFAFAFATDVLTEQIKFYGMKPSIMYQVLFVLSTQVIGYTFAGLSRQWLVYPSSMIWPSTLVNCALFQVLHPLDKVDDEPNDNSSISSGDLVPGPSRARFFFILFTLACIWAFVPSFFVPALSYFSIFTWFAPKNLIINTILGVKSGLGIFPFTFDWAQVSFTGSPILVPWWAQVNALAGVAIFLWIIAPILYYTNTFYTGYLPFLDSNIFDNTGNYYNVSRIITDEVTFDISKYESYSPLYLPAAYVMSYWAAFASLTALIVHCYLFYKDDIMRQWRASRSEATHSDGDVHTRLMRRYDEVPSLWYVTIFFVCLAVAMYVVQVDEVGLPWYGLLLALAICALFFVPMGIINAIANQNASTALLCQLICGAAFPGRPIANMVFLTYGYIGGMQGIRFAADMKIGTYMKIPPRLLFKVQLAATVVGSLTQVSVLNFLFAAIPKICQIDAPNGLTCPIARIHFNSSIIWGLVGPGRLFGKDALYHALMYAFPIGAILPIPIYLMAMRNKKNSNSFWHLVNMPVILSILTWVPPAGGLNVSSWAFVGFLSNVVLKRSRPDLWQRYNFVASAALDMGLAVALVIGFFALVYTGYLEQYGLEFGSWLYKDTCDWNGCPNIALGSGEVFGRHTW